MKPEMPKPIAYAVESVHDGDVKEIDLFKTIIGAEVCERIHGGVTTTLYTADQMRSFAAACVEEALERAASQFESEGCPRIAEDIRAFKETKEQ